MRRIVLLRHNHGPTDDRVTNFCQSSGLIPDTRYPFAGDDPGGISEDLAGVVVYGGKYNADATDPFLRDEYRLIDAAITAGIPLLGICQGAQMIARHLGAWTGAPGHGQHEFGYYEVAPTAEGHDFLQQPLHMAQWHFHSYDLPQGAVHLARSAQFEQQAFRVGQRIYGLQFHAEQTIEGFRRWQSMAEDGVDRPGAQNTAEQTRLMHLHDAAMATWFYGFLETLFGVNAG